MPGVDVLFVGAGDPLPVDGLHRPTSPPEVQKLVEHGVKTIVQAGRIAGCSCPDILIPKFLDLGARYFHSTVGRLLQHGSDAYLKAARQRHPTKPDPRNPVIPVQTVTRPRRRRPMPTAATTGSP